MTLQIQVWSLMRSLEHGVKVNKNLTLVASGTKSNVQCNISIQTARLYLA